MRSIRRRGMVALELMAATVLLALVLVPFLTTTVDTGREAGFSEAYLLASARAEALVDAARPQDWPGAGEVRPLPIPGGIGPAPALPGTDASEYGEQLTLRALEDGLVLVTATVRWAAPLPHAADRARESVAFRLLARPDGGWSIAAPTGRGGPAGK